MTHTDHELSQWADLLCICNGNYAQAAAAWRENNDGADPPCEHGQQEGLPEKDLMWRACALGGQDGCWGGLRGTARHAPGAARARLCG
jgi:hypothetical protein